MFSALRRGSRCWLVALALPLTLVVAVSVHAQTTINPNIYEDSVEKGKAPVTQYTLSPEKLAKSYALYEVRGWLIVVSTIYSFALLIGFVRSRWTVTLRDWAERASARRFFQATIVIPLFAVSFLLLRLPLAIYGHHVSLKFGLSVQRWGSWLRDWVLELALVAVVGTIVVWIFYEIVSRSPRWWWFYFWLAIIPISAFLTFIAPVAIDPLFYNSEPLAAKHSGLVEALQEVSQHGGLDIPRNRMYAMEASTKLTGPNAYVTGFGATKRVVVWDTAIQQFTTPELMLVFGHEMGHYVLGHITRGYIEAMIFAFVLLFLTWWIVSRVQHTQGPRWGIRSLDDWASLPVLIVIAALISFLSTPILNAESRRIEHDADVYGLEVTHGLVRDGGLVDARAFQILGENWLEYPHPSTLAVLWDYDHPPIADRIHFAMTYDPWSKGESPRFVKTPAAK
jgi:Zn-dependent protease with chaperone function